jgi:hypothetical protein
MVKYDPILEKFILKCQAELDFLFKKNLLIKTQKSIF